MTNETTKDVAEKMGKLIVDVADRISLIFDEAARNGVDPNTLREKARDTINETLKCGSVRAANIVRLAVYKTNRRQGITTYSDLELQVICHRIAHG